MADIMCSLFCVCHSVCASVLCDVTNVRCQK